MTATAPKEETKTPAVAAEPPAKKTPRTDLKLAAERGAAAADAIIGDVGSAIEEDFFNAAMKKRTDLAVRSVVKVMGESFVEEALSHMLGEERMKGLIERYSPATRVKIVTPNSETVESIGLHHCQFEEVLTAVQCGNVCLVGPAGSGKTTLVGQIAKALGLPFYFTGAITSEFKLTGFINAQGNIVRTPFRDAYENGGVFLFDEMDASTPQAVLAFNNGLANDAMDFPDACVPRHKDFYCVAAANTFWTGADLMYVGRNQLDAASLDRFTFIEFNYDERLELLLGPDRGFTRLVQAYRKAAQELKIAHVISPRASIVGGKLLKAGMPADRVIQVQVLKGLRGEDAEKLKNRANGIASAMAAASKKEAK